VLLPSEGKADLEIAAELRIGNHKVARWRNRSLKSVWPDLRTTRLAMVESRHSRFCEAGNRP
jgi:hypothetical protein